MYSGIAKVRDSGQGRPLFLLHFLGLCRLTMVVPYQVKNAVDQQQGQLPINGLGLRRLLRQGLSSGLGI